MDWNVAIKRNRSDLAKIVAGLYVLAGWVPGGERPAFIGRIARNELSRLLRVTEAALRRLILIMVTVNYYKQSKGKKVRRPLPDFSLFGKSSGKRAPVFNLIDPRKPMVFLDEETFYGTKSHGSQPRIWTLDAPAPLVTVALRQAQGEGFAGNFSAYAAAQVEATSRDASASAIVRQTIREANCREGDGSADALTEYKEPPNPASLLRRLEALDLALKSLPRQAKRMARAIEQRKTAPPGRGRIGVIRPGFPPGHSDRKTDARWGGLLPEQPKP